jgi:hypothetical protein
MAPVPLKLPWSPFQSDPHPELILGIPSLFEDGVDSMKVSGFLLVNLTHICGIILLGTVDADDMKSSLG